MIIIRVILVGGSNDNHGDIKHKDSDDCADEDNKNDIHY